MIRQVWFGLMAVLVLAMSPAVSWAMVNAEEPAEDDRRFDAVGAFSRAHWLGLFPHHENARDHTWVGAATLIAPDRVITAKHLFPGNRTPDRGAIAIRFRRHVDGTLGSRQAGPQSYHHVRVVRWLVHEQADLAIGILEEPVTHIEPIRVWLDPQPYLGREAWLAGWGSQSHWQGNAGPRNALRVGKNRVQRVPNHPFIRIIDYTTENREQSRNEETGEVVRKPYITSEATVPNMHDSGGAILLEDEQGNLHLAGVIFTYVAALSVEHHFDATALGITPDDETADEETADQ